MVVSLIKTLSRKHLNGKGVHFDGHFQKAFGPSWPRRRTSRSVNTSYSHCVDRKQTELDCTRRRPNLQRPAPRDYCHQLEGSVAFQTASPTMDQALIHGLLGDLTLSNHKTNSAWKCLNETRTQEQLCPSGAIHCDKLSQRNDTHSCLSLKETKVLQ